MLSPDGTRFAFVAEGAIWTVPLSGTVRPDIAGTPTRLTPDMGAWDGGNMTFGWSLDGRWIAFRGRPEDSVYVVPSTGGDPKKAEGSDTFGQGGRPSLSPDGTTVAFTRWHEKRSHVFVSSLASGAPKLLTEEPGMYPTFSPDGKLVAYVPSSYSADRGMTPPKTMQIKVAAVQGGATSASSTSPREGSTPRLGLPTGR
jgi:Tol biopolymer transport system component